MKLHVLGAAGEVTGSCYILEAGRTRVMIDFGLHQGEREADEHNRRMPPGLDRLDAVVLTHAHVDHIGRTPMLVSAGFRGPVFCTPATRDLCGIMLRDSARLQADDARRDARRGQPVQPALYEEEHVETFLRMIRSAGYESDTHVAPGVRVRFVDSGHMLGSASLAVMVEEPGRPARRIVFSGDIGPRGVPLLRDPVPPSWPGGERPDLVVMESTYGDRDHRALDATVQELREICADGAWERRKMLMPAFAVGRAQLLIYYLGKVMESGKSPRFPVYLDSPMAIEGMKLYRRYAGLLDAGEGANGLAYPELHLCETGDESRAINDAEGPLAVIAGSGMCNGGRILHHLRHNVWRKDTHVIIAGYQAAGTLGRRLVTGATEVRIFGESVPVRAKVHTLGGLSAHAGQTELVGWAEQVVGPSARARVVLTHGEDAQRHALGAKLRERLGIECVLPAYADTIEV